jgi:hypothetical protein
VPAGRDKKLLTNRPHLPRTAKPSRNSSLTADSQFFQIQLHQMLEINLQIVFGKIGQELWLGAFVNLANTVYQLPFAHTPILKNRSALSWNYRNIDRTRFFSLAHQATPASTPYNIRHYIKASLLTALPHMAAQLWQFWREVSMSNKNPRSGNEQNSKKMQISFFLSGWCQMQRHFFPRLKLGLIGFDFNSS